MKKISHAKQKFTATQLCIFLLFSFIIYSFPWSLNQNAYASNLDNLPIFEVTQTSMTVTPRGDKYENRKLENRHMTHSSLEPTGRFVQSGEKLTINVAGNENPYLKVHIGVLGMHEQFKTSEIGNMTMLGIELGEQTIVAPVSGMVYIENNSNSVSNTVNVSGGQKVPVFFAGVTTQKAWVDQLNTFSNAPFVELIGERIIATFQYATAVQPLKNRLVEEMIFDFDKVVDITDEVYGLNRAEVGINNKGKQRVHIVNPDNGPGYAYAADPSGGPYLAFHNGNGAGVDLLSGNKNSEVYYALWHEIAHTYQTLQYLWTTPASVTEITTEIPTLRVEEKLGFPFVDTSFGPANKLKKAKEEAKRYLSSPLQDRNFDDITIPYSYVPVVMFEQLHYAFGDNFYAELSQEYRIRNANDDFGFVPDITSLIASEQKKQAFIEITSYVAQRDLVPFFEQWGLKANDETKANTSVYPKLSEDILQNVISDVLLVENKIGRTTPSMGEDDSKVKDVVLDESLDKSAGDSKVKDVVLDESLDKSAGDSKVKDVVLDESLDKSAGDSKVKDVVSDESLDKSADLGENVDFVDGKNSHDSGANSSGEFATSQDHHYASNGETEDKSALNVADNGSLLANTGFNLGFVLCIALIFCASGIIFFRRKLGFGCSL